MKTLKFEGFEICQVVEDGMHEKHVRYVSTKELAEQICSGNVLSNYRPTKQEFILFESISEVIAADLEGLRKSARAKLTHAEREALGLL